MKFKKIHKKIQILIQKNLEIAKLKNLRVIIGGGDDTKDDPIDTNHQKRDSSDRGKPPQA